MLSQAISYLERGWNVIPLGANKKPLIGKWIEYQQQRVTPSQLKAWWERWPEANIGVITGSISNLVVVDIDSASGQRALHEGFPELFSKELKGVLSSKTGRGGTHLFFDHPGSPVPNAVNILPGVDIRGDGGYVLVPPSVSVKGTYTWRNEGSPGSLPSSFKSFIVAKKASKGITEEDWNSVVVKGSRDNELARRAGKLLRSQLPAPEVIDILDRWNKKHCKPPLARADIERIVKSIQKKENNKTQPTEASTQQFSVVSFQQALEKHGLTEMDWLVDQWLPQATCGLVVAPPGTYKTWLLLELALSISTGSPFMGTTPNATGPVVVVQQEDPFPMLFSRLGQIMKIGPVTEKKGTWQVPLPPKYPPIYWHVERMLHLNSKASIDGLQKVIEQLRPKLVIIDPLYSIASAKDFMSEAAEGMLIFKRMRDVFGCSFLVAHHTTKKPGSKQGSREEAWGSQFLNAWLETGWQIRPTDSPGSVSLKRHFKSTAPPPVLKLTFQISEFDYQVNVSHAADNETDAEQEILATIEENDITDQRTLAKMTNLGIATVNRVLKKNSIEKVAGVYRVK